MLIPASASVSKMSAATPGWLRMPAPTTEILRDVGVDAEAGGLDRVGELLEDRLGALHVLGRAA